MSSIGSSTNLSSLLRQAIKDPDAHQPKPFSAEGPELRSQSGFAGVRREVDDDRFTGSGLNLKLELSSGQSIRLDIQKSISGRVKHIELSTQGELSKDDQQRLEQFVKKLSSSMDDLFSGNNQSKGLFDFAKVSGVKDIDLTIQQDNGTNKQRLEFEKQAQANGRNELDAQWVRQNKTTGEKEHHSLALSHQARDLIGFYGQIDPGWIMQQVEAGMGILGNDHTGDNPLKQSVTGFFVSGVQALFNQANDGYQMLQDLGANARDAKNFIGKSIQAITPSNEKPVDGSLGSELDKNQAMNGMPDLQAHFASEREGGHGGSYKLTMELSQMSHFSADINEDIQSQDQIRRLLLNYESETDKKQYEYQWRRDEQYRQGSNPESGTTSYYKLTDEYQSVLRQNGQERREQGHFLQRTEYKGNNQQTNPMHNGYMPSSTHISRGQNINNIA